MMLAFSAGMIFGVFGFEQVAEFVGIEKGSSLASGQHLHSAGIREASTKIAAVDSQGCACGRGGLVRCEAVSGLPASGAVVAAAWSAKLRLSATGGGGGAGAWPDGAPTATGAGCACLSAIC